MRRSNIRCRPINHPELIRLILLAALTENLSTRRNLGVRGEWGRRAGGRRVYAGRHPAPAPRSRTRTSTSPSRDPGDNSPPSMLTRRLISQDAPPVLSIYPSICLSISVRLSFVLLLLFGKFADTLINRTRGALARVGATANRSRLKVPHRCKQTALLRVEAEWLQNARESKREGGTR